jgi:hypothetical protein
VRGEPGAFGDEVVLHPLVGGRGDPISTPGGENFKGCASSTEQARMVLFGALIH